MSEPSDQDQMVLIREVTAPREVAQVRSLFAEYGASLGFSLCFQGFEQEMAALPGMYAAPSGRLLLATIRGAPAGCAGMHRLGDAVAEMKRLYVRPAFRGQGLGRSLAERIVSDARGAGYRSIRLDTVVGPMDAAIALYRELGFRDIAPYRANPVPGALHMELEL
ncbi:MAG TPA: GNAT family N-acetyltransferase [Gemmatimonadales bacterium]|nr:GNAT family N-acetyltransferase [Gemmatimonadales bacterium]